MTIWERVAAALAALQPLPASTNVLAATGEALPDRYLVYHLIGSSGLYADNREIGRSYQVRVLYFDRADLNHPPDIKGAMLAAGFSGGDPAQLPDNSQTRHFCLSMEFNYLEE